ncbi:MAG TPA: type IX secretion system membrane protein PorP/SprF [Crocinitomix sp.]|nr:type IX secretion system membrane protein PorP/SprF [Crocinitomix sp.]
MKRLFLLGILLSFNLLGYSQQQEHLTQYQFNQFVFNPALAGSKPCIDIRLGYRLQWVGIEGAPQNGFVNAHAPLRIGKKRRSMYGPSHGIGGMVRRDEYGPFSNSEVHLAYAYHIPVKRNVKLSFGLSFGFKQTAFDANMISTLYFDNAIPASTSFIVFPDAKFGTWLKTKNEYFGFSIQNLFGNKMDKIGSESRYRRHFYLTAGKKFKLEKGWSLIPSLFVLKTYRTPIDFHLSALFDLNNKITFGVGLRRTDAITAQIRVKLLNFISIGYSFDFIISKLQKNMYQTHEVTIGMNGCSNYGSSSTINCPTFE